MCVHVCHPSWLLGRTHWRTHCLSKWMFVPLTWVMMQVLNHVKVKSSSSFSILYEIHTSSKVQNKKKQQNTLVIQHRLVWFQDGIEPMWEDMRNRQGGRWLITLSKQQRKADLDRFWLETVRPSFGYLTSLIVSHSLCQLHLMVLLFLAPVSRGWGIWWLQRRCVWRCH